MCRMNQKEQVRNARESTNQIAHQAAAAAAAAAAAPRSNLSSETSALTLLLFSSMLFSIMATFAKLAVGSGLHSSEVVFLRASFQGLIVFASLFFVSVEMDGQQHAESSENLSQSKLIYQPFGATPIVRKVVLARGLFGGFGFVNYYYTLGALPLGDAIALLSLNPIVTLIFASLFLGEIINSTQLIATIASVSGAILIAQPTFLFDEEQDVGEINSFGYATAIMGCCASAGVNILIRKGGMVGAHTLQLLSSWVIFGLAFSLVTGQIVRHVDGGRWIYPPSLSSWLFVLGVGIFGTVAHFLMNYAGRIAPAGLASIIRSSSTMWAYLLQIFVFRQVPSIETILGNLLIAGALLGIAFQKFHEISESKMSVSQTNLEKFNISETTPLAVPAGSVDAEGQMNNYVNK